MRTSRVLIPLVLTVVALFLAAWLMTAFRGMHADIAKQSQTLALVFLGVAGVSATVSLLALARLMWRMGHPERPPAQAPEDVVRAAELQAEKAEAVIAQVGDTA